MIRAVGHIMITDNEFTAYPESSNRARVLHADRTMIDWIPANQALFTIVV
jgi:hypothetical protein